MGPRALRLRSRALWHRKYVMCSSSSISATGAHCRHQRTLQQYPSRSCERCWQISCRSGRTRPLITCFSLRCSRDKLVRAFQLLTTSKHCCHTCSLVRVWSLQLLHGRGVWVPELEKAVEWDQCSDLLLQIASWYDNTWPEVAAGYTCLLSKQVQTQSNTAGLTSRTLSLTETNHFVCECR